MGNSVQSLQDLAQNCAAKRAALLMIGHMKGKWGKRLQVAGGVLALISAASITAVIAELTNSLTVKIFSAGAGFASGLLSLLGSSYFGEDERNRIYVGAGKFLLLRDRVDGILQRPGLTEEKAFAELQKWRGDYAQYSMEFDKYIGNTHHRSDYSTATMRYPFFNWHADMTSRIAKNITRRFPR
jgi:hypothetical protein